LKTLSSLLSRFAPCLEDLSADETPIGYLIHAGEAKPAKREVKAMEMKCPTCGGSQGYLCMHYGKKAWFCGKLECLADCAKKSKANEKWEPGLHHKSTMPLKRTETPRHWTETEKPTLDMAE
jgi:hypothetical protein